MKPLILDYSEKRKGDIETIYDYDFQKSLNVIEIDDKKKPFIDSNREDISLLTKTQVESEGDDDPPSHVESETKTFTSAKRERDDESPNNI